VTSQSSDSSTIPSLRLHYPLLTLYPTPTLEPSPMPPLSAFSLFVKNNFDLQPLRATQPQQALGNTSRSKHTGSPSNRLAPYTDTQQSW
jgi:hypothetical protein